MALSDTQKSQIIFYLGWPGKTLIENSTNYSKIVSDRLANLTTDVEDQVSKLLGKLKKVDDKLEEALCRMSTTKVDGIHINERERVLLKAERKRYQYLLSDLLDIPVQSTGAAGVQVVV